MADENFKKISFELEPDADGYPPDRWESLWALEDEPGLYRVDNIPFYVKGVSSGDVVTALPNGGPLQFERVVRPSGNSVVRLYVSDESDMKATKDSFRELGCESELHSNPKFVAVEIPNTVSAYPVDVLLEAGAKSGRWEYEWGVLRHPIPA